MVLFNAINRNPDTFSESAEQEKKEESKLTLFNPQADISQLPEEERRFRTYLINHHIAEPSKLSLEDIKVLYAPHQVERLITYKCPIKRIRMQVTLSFTSEYSYPLDHADVKEVQLTW
jgi:hypothetical protein